MYNSSPQATHLHFRTVEQVIQRTRANPSGAARSHANRKREWSILVTPDGSATATSGDETSVKGMKATAIDNPTIGSLIQETRKELKVAETLAVSRMSYKAREYTSYLIFATFTLKKYSGWHISFACWSSLDALAIPFPFFKIRFRILTRMRHTIVLGQLHHRNVGDQTGGVSLLQLAVRSLNMTGNLPAGREREATTAEATTMPGWSQSLALPII